MKHVAAVFPDLAFAMFALAFWIVPSIFPNDSAEIVARVLVFEFIAIHALGFTATVVYGRTRGAARWIAAGALGALYTILIGVSFRAISSIVAFWILMINRVLPLLAERVGEEQRKHLFLSWGISTAIFVGCALLTTFAPVPRLGLTTPPPMSGSGLWVDEPQRPLLFAFLYYSIAAHAELRIHRRVASRG